jgi:hypothetical protein
LLPIPRRARTRPLDAADSLQMKKIEDGRRKFRDQLAVIVGISAVGNVTDFRGEILADAGNLTQPGGVEG